MTTKNVGGLPNESPESNKWRAANGQLFYLSGSLFFLLSLIAIYFILPWFDLNAGSFKAVPNSVASLIPSIKKLSVGSLFPKLTETYLSFVWISIVTVCGIMALRKYPLDNRKWIPKKGRWLVFTVLVLFTTSWWAIAFVGFPLNDLMKSNTLAGFISRSISTSKVGLALFGTTLFLILPILTASSIVVLRNFYRLWLAD